MYKKIRNCTKNMYIIKEHIKSTSEQMIQVWGIIVNTYKMQVCQLSQKSNIIESN